MTQQIHIGTYPYTFARVSVMKAELLQTEDYHRLMKMGPNQILGFLQESAYRREISEFGVSEQGLDLLERALNRNLEDTFNKLRRISKKGLLELIDVYLARYDVADIKTILRAHYTGLPAEQTEHLVTAAGHLTREQLRALIEKESVHDVVALAASMKLVPAMAAALDTFTKTNSLQSIEDALDRHYYKQVFAFAERLPRAGAMFREFLQGELEVENIINILRLKRAGVDEKGIVQQLLPSNSKFAHRIAELIRADIESAPDILKNTQYAGIVRSGIEQYKQTQSLIALETGLYSYLLGKTTTLLRRKPLSVDYILGYMFAKQMEVKNIRAIMRGKQLEVDENFIESQLVVRNA